MTHSGDPASVHQSSPPRYIDTHCHLDDAAFSADLGAVLERSRLAGVRSWINVGYAPERWRSTVDLASNVPGMAVMLGLHPAEAERWTQKLEDDLVALLKSSGARAVGETGIDLFRGETNPARQRDAFARQLDIAVELQLPAVIHMRAAEAEVLDILGSMKALPRLLFHSFDGSPDLAGFVDATGACVGVGGLATRPASHRLREQLSRISPDQIVLETDAPYLVPAEVRGRRNEPGNIPIIASALASLLGTNVDHIAAVTTANAERLFGEMESA